MRKAYRAEDAAAIRDLTIKVYETAASHAKERGIIIADTKFEFGVYDGKIILGDEVLTPDSSRFWAADTYKVGEGTAQLRQAVRAQLAQCQLGPHWQPAAPARRHHQEDQRKVHSGLRENHGQDVCSPVGPDENTTRRIKGCLSETP